MFTICFGIGIGIGIIIYFFNTSQSIYTYHCFAYTKIMIQLILNLFVVACLLPQTLQAQRFREQFANPRRLTTSTCGKRCLPPMIRSDQT